MPYLPEERKQELDKDPLLANTVGDLNYLFTVEYLKIWLAEPRYATIHKIKEASQNRDSSTAINVLENKLWVSFNFTTNELNVAKELAFLEFYRRVGAEYEEYCIIKNGDLKEYQQAEELMSNKYNQGATK